MSSAAPPPSSPKREGLAAQPRFAGSGHETARVSTSSSIPVSLFLNSSSSPSELVYASPTATALHPLGLSDTVGAAVGSELPAISRKSKTHGQANIALRALIHGICSFPFSPSCKFAPFESPRRPNCAALFFFGSQHCRCSRSSRFPAGRVSRDTKAGDVWRYKLRFGVLLNACSAFVFLCLSVS
jgi:hypothetical protein